MATMRALGQSRRRLRPMIALENLAEATKVTT